MTLDHAHQLAILLTLLSGLLWPLLTAIVTKATEPPAVRAILLPGISALATLVTSLTAALAGHGGYDWFTWGCTFLATWAIAVASKYGLYIPTDIYSNLLGTGRKDRAPGQHLKVVSRPQGGKWPSWQTAIEVPIPESIHHAEDEHGATV